MCMQFSTPDIPLKKCNNSLEDQVRNCREKVETESWNLGETYAVSGATTLRPSYFDHARMLMAVQPSKKIITNFDVHLGK